MFFFAVCLTLFPSVEVAKANFISIYNTIKEHITASCDLLPMQFKREKRSLLLYLKCVYLPIFQCKDFLDARNTSIHTVKSLDLSVFNYSVKTVGIKFRAFCCCCCLKFMVFYTYDCIMVSWRLISLFFLKININILPAMIEIKFAKDWISIHTTMFKCYQRYVLNTPSNTSSFTLFVPKI